MKLMNQNGEVFTYDEKNDRLITSSGRVLPSRFYRRDIDKYLAEGHMRLVYDSSEYGRNSSVTERVKKGSMLEDRNGCVYTVESTEGGGVWLSWDTCYPEFVTMRDLKRYYKVVDDLYD